MTEMRARLREAIAALNRLEEVWDEDQVQNYPSYLPSFPELIHDLSDILEPDGEAARSQLRLLGPDDWAGSV